MEIVKQTIDRFRMDLLRVLGDELCEIVIHGSYALGDFTPFKGDLDYTVVTVHDLGDAAMAALFDLHDGYRREKQLLLHQLEGTTYPRGVLADPARPCVGCYIGTGRAGWRTITAFTNSLIDLRIMAESGIRVLGGPLDIFRPSEAAIRTLPRDLAGWTNPKPPWKISRGSLSSMRSSAAPTSSPSCARSWTPIRASGT
ncbi:MAG: hypothetical protein ABIF71_00155 [Planctomycetota bacterium]